MKIRQTPSGAGDDPGTAGEGQPGGRQSRRVLITGAVAAGAGLAAGMLVRPAAAEAANGDAMFIGAVNAGTQPTTLTTSAQSAFEAATNDTTKSSGWFGLSGVDNSHGGGFGVYGTSINGTGVGGVTSANNQYGVGGEDTSTGGGYGVYGNSTNGTGVRGVTSANNQYGVIGFDASTGGGYGVWGTSDNGTGVWGDTSANGQSAVFGTDTSSGGGFGVQGNSFSGTGVLGSSFGGPGVTGAGTNGAIGVSGSSDTGPGVAAQSTTGVALQVTGKVTFSSSGLATVAASKASVTVTLAGVTKSSMILATLQQAAGTVAVASAVPASGSFTIHLTAAPTSKVKIAYFIIG